MRLFTSESCLCEEERYSLTLTDNSVVALPSKVGYIVDHCFRNGDLANDTQRVDAR